MTLPDFDALYTRHAPPLAAFCRLLAGRDADAQDLFQSTWARALERIADYREEGSFRAWLSTLAYRLWVDRKRRLNTETQALQILAREPQAPEGADPEELRLLRDALARLDEGEREAVLLYDVEGLTLRQAAEALGVSHTAVRERIAKTHRELGKSLLPVSK